MALRDGAPHAYRSVQSGDQHLGQSRHGQLLHRQPAARRPQHPRAEKSQDRSAGPSGSSRSGTSNTRPCSAPIASRRRCSTSTAIRTRTCRPAVARDLLRAPAAGRDVEWALRQWSHRPPNSVGRPSISKTDPRVVRQVLEERGEEESELWNLEIWNLIWNLGIGGSGIYRVIGIYHVIWNSRSIWIPRVSESLPRSQIIQIRIARFQIHEIPDFG